MARQFTEYQTIGHKRLRLGYTTGSCAAAAAKAALRMLLTGQNVSEITIATPKGIALTLDVLDIRREDSCVSCAIQKDSGDDADVTDGIKIYASVSYHQTSDIIIDGGIGIGRITKPGLEQPVGAAAINSTPRKMIRDAALAELADAGYEGGILVTISAPEGVGLAAKTFNPNLGIEGGISILGTSGIVEPMSERALLETIRLEIQQKSATGHHPLLLVPGNYGQRFMKEQFSLDLEKSVKCSNFVGEAFDYALELGFQEILFIGHIGKLVKIGSGIMNTHSKMADARLETLCACALLAGCDADLAVQVLTCTTTDEAISILKNSPYFKACMDILLKKILYHLQHRTEHAIQIEIIIFSNEFGILTQSAHAKDFIEKINNDMEKTQ